MVALLFAIGILAGASGAILMKVGVAELHGIGISNLAQLFSFLFKIFTNFYVLFGMGLYFFSALVWTYLLTKLDISFVQPILALTYVVTPILALVFLGEMVPSARWIGILVIILGVYIVSRTGLK